LEDGRPAAKQDGQASKSAPVENEKSGTDLPF